MLRIKSVAGNSLKFYTADMKMGSVPNLGRRGDYRRECCPASILALKFRPTF